MRAEELAPERTHGDDASTALLTVTLDEGSVIRIHPVARRDHPLATCGTPIPPALLRAHPQIVLRDSGHDPAAPSLNVLEGGVRWSVTDVTAKRDVIWPGWAGAGFPSTSSRTRSRRASSCVSRSRSSTFVRWSFSRSVAAIARTGSSRMRSGRRSDAAALARRAAVVPDIARSGRPPRRRAAGKPAAAVGPGVSAPLPLTYHPAQGRAREGAPRRRRGEVSGRESYAVCP